MINISGQSGDNEIHNNSMDAEIIYNYQDVISEGCW